MIVLSVILAYFSISTSTNNSTGGIQQTSTLQSSSSPTLQATVNVAPSSVDLSAEGRLDWIHWGYLESDQSSTAQFIGHPVRVDCQTNTHCMNRKQNGNAQISDFTTVGSFDTSKLPYRLYVRDIPTHFSWSDGSPVSSVADARTQVYIAGVGNGYQIQIPADQTIHTFRLYIGIWNSKVQYTASLSDVSAPDYINTSLAANSSTYVFTFTYRAASPNQKLLVTLTILADYGGANSSLSAATLQ